MSLEAFTTFLESNPEALEKVKACSNHAEVAAIAKANGIDVSPAELMKAAAQATAELDDDDGGPDGSRVHSVTLFRPGPRATCNGF